MGAQFYRMCVHVQKLALIIVFKRFFSPNIRIKSLIFELYKLFKYFIKNYVVVFLAICVIVSLFFLQF